MVAQNSKKSNHEQPVSSEWQLPDMHTHLEALQQWVCQSAQDGTSAHVLERGLSAFADRLSYKGCALSRLETGKMLNPTLATLGQFLAGGAGHELAHRVYCRKLVLQLRNATVVLEYNSGEVRRKKWTCGTP
jgi:hypothetical protein